MALHIYRKKTLRSIFVTSRNYCEHKSIYERHEAGKQPRKVYGKEYPEWRTPWIERDGEWKSKLSLFVEKSPSMHFLNVMQKLPDLTLADIKKWYADLKILQEIKNQDYLPERTTALGFNLAAIHFFVFRQAAVRLKNSKHWIIGDITSFKIPNHFVEGYQIEAIDCSNFHHNGIRYEGLKNLYGLNFLKSLSLRNNKYVDVWCVDRVAGQNGDTIEFLNLTGCNLCSGCINSLAKMSALKFLVISDPGDNIELQASLSMLEQEKPHLLIKIDDDVDNIEKTADKSKA